MFSHFYDKEENEAQKEECKKLKKSWVYKWEKVSCRAFYALLDNEEIFSK